MPQDPIEYRLVKNLQSALQTIRVQDGYHYTVATAAVKLDPEHDVEARKPPDGLRPFILIEVMTDDRPDRWEYDGFGQLKLFVPATIWWVSDSTPTDDDSRLRTFLRGCADVEKAITIDNERGGLAANTLITKRTFRAVGAEVWALVDVDMWVHRVYGQPN